MSWFFWSKKSQKTKKFVIILSAGRCGSTYLIQELNKIPQVNIYGENYNFFTHLIKSIYSLRNTLSITSEQATIKAKVARVLMSYLGDSKYNFTGLEFYNNKNILRKMLDQLEEFIEEYFDGYSVSGFKEIRFWDKDLIMPLRYFEEKYEVYYIHLTRDIEEQSRSGFYVDSSIAKKTIENINNTIEQSLGHKPGYFKVDISQISTDITLVRDFIGV